MRFTLPATVFIFEQVGLVMIDPVIAIKYMKLNY